MANIFTNRIHQIIFKLILKFSKLFLESVGFHVFTAVISGLLHSVCYKNQRSELLCHLHLHGGKICEHRKSVNVERC
jgi:hypothetical protein